MRKDSCRSCGSDPIPCTRCLVCREPIVFFCQKCIDVDAKLHMHFADS